MCLLQPAIRIFGEFVHHRHPPHCLGLPQLVRPLRPCLGGFWAGPSASSFRLTTHQEIDIPHVVVWTDLPLDLLGAGPFGRWDGDHDDRNYACCHSIAGICVWADTNLRIMLNVTRYRLYLRHIPVLLPRPPSSRLNRLGRGENCRPVVNTQHGFVAHYFLVISYIPSKLSACTWNCRFCELLFQLYEVPLELYPNCCPLLLWMASGF